MAASKRIGFWAIVLTFVFSGIALAARGSGRVIKQDRDVTGFSEVTVAIAGKVILEQGDTEGVTVEADEDLIDDIVTDVRGRRLVIEFRQRKWGWHFRSRPDVLITVRFKELSAVSVSGSADVTADKMHGDDMDLSISGSGDMTIGDMTARQLEVGIGGSGAITVEKLSADRVRSGISGSGDVEIAGKAAALRIGISGSGSVDASALEVKDANVHISGSGTARVNTSENLTGTISGSGNVWYRGRPLVDVSTPGSGSVRPMGR